MTSAPPWRRPAPPQRRGRQRRAEILLAAQELIDTEGPNGPGVTIRGISDRAGVAPATIYHYFADMEAVVAAVAVEYMHDLVRATAPAFGTCTSAREFLDMLIGIYHDYFASRPGLRELWFDRRANETVVQVHLHYRAELVDRLRCEIARYTDRPGTRAEHAVTIALVGALWELAFAELDNGDPEVIRQIVEVCCDYWQRQFDLPMRA